jgi:hypothetical protein
MKKAILFILAQMVDSHPQLRTEIEEHRVAVESEKAEPTAKPVKAGKKK